MAISSREGRLARLREGIRRARDREAAPATSTRDSRSVDDEGDDVAALAMLVDEGKLKWDDRVIDYIPDFQLYDSYATREVTVRDLLTHRTGCRAQICCGPAARINTRSPR